MTDRCPLCLQHLPLPASRKTRNRIVQLLSDAGNAGLSTRQIAVAIGNIEPAAVRAQIERINVRLAHTTGMHIAPAPWAMRRWVLLKKKSDVA